MMHRHFQVLYRQFLLRVIDLELLSTQGDLTKLLGQFAALLVFLGMIFSMSLMGAGDGRTPRNTLLINAWGFEHLLIATTMLVVGLFAVLSWDSTFPDRRDLLVLSPLPVRARTLFLAKTAATASALSLTVATLNALPGALSPLAFAPPSSGLLDLILTPDLYRWFAAYWVTMASAGAFIFGSLLTIQGLAAQLLSRPLFLRVSGWLQTGSFCLLISVYFLEPSMAAPDALTAPENQRLLAWLPSYWFLGLFQDLNDSMHPALAPMARRAWIGLLIIGCGTVLTYSLAYFRTLRRIMEEPDITPSAHAANWLPRFGNRFQTAVVQFSIRTLLRSRQHRMIFAFYLGSGFAITILLLKGLAARRQLSGSPAAAWGEISVPLLASSIVMMILWMVGARVVCSMPFELPSNWIIRIAPVRGGDECLAARRRTLLLLGLAPVLSGATVVFLSIWSWESAAGHIIVLGLLGTILAELCLCGVEKIPFTCSYLPGKSNFHMTFWFCIGFIWVLIVKGAELERRALGDRDTYLVMVVILAVLACLARWRTAWRAKSGNGELQFDDTPPSVILELGLPRHGILAPEPVTERSSRAE